MVPRMSGWKVKVCTHGTRTSRSIGFPLEQSRQGCKRRVDVPGCGPRRWIGEDALVGVYAGLMRAASISSRILIAVPPLMGLPAVPDRVAGRRRAWLPAGAVG